MKAKHVLKSGSLAFLLLLLSFSYSCNEEIPPPPDTTEIEGTWRVHSFVICNKNDLSSWQGWLHSVLNIDDIGNAVFSDVVSSPGADSGGSSSKIEISPEKVITVQGDPSYHGYLSIDKQLVVATMTDGSGGHNLSFAQKINPAIIYKTSDVQGIWQMHSLSDSKKSSFTSWTGWAHASMSFDANGRGIFTNVETSPGAYTANDSLFVSVSSSGVISDSLLSTYHGFMSADKKLVVATMNSIDGGFTLAISQKIILGTSYALSDLVGTWQMHSVVSSTNISGYDGWINAKLTIDNSGNGIFSEIEESSGMNIYNDPGLITISSSGIVEIAGDNTFHGYLSSDKSTLVATLSDYRGGYTITVLQKQL